MPSSSARPFWYSQVSYRGYEVRVHINPTVYSVNGNFDESSLGSCSVPSSLLLHLLLLGSCRSITFLSTFTAPTHNNSHTHRRGWGEHTSTDSAIYSHFNVSKLFHQLYYYTRLSVAKDTPATHAHSLAPWIRTGTLHSCQLNNLTQH